MRASGLWDEPIVTRIERDQRFYPAEAYHQDFMRKNPDHRYIRRWDAPKVAALRAAVPARSIRAGFTDRLIAAMSARAYIGGHGRSPRITNIRATSWSRRRERR